MSSEVVLTIAGVILSLLFEYVPGLNAWYNNLEDNPQRAVMLGAIFVTVAGALGLSCVGWAEMFACDAAGVQEAVYAFFLALIANQSAHRILPRA